MDLAVAVHNRRWRQLHDLIAQLPAHARTWAAMVNDPDLAEELAAQRGADSAGGPRKDFVEVQELTPEVKALGFIINMIAAMTGAKNFDYLKIHTAQQEAEAKAQLEQAFSLIYRLQPKEK